MVTERTDTYILKGQVTDISGQAVSNVIVSLYDNKHLYDERLGKIVTDEKGAFTFTFRKDAFPEIFEKKTKLFLKVMDQQGETLYTSAKKFYAKAGQVKDYPVKLKKKVDDTVCDPDTWVVRG